MFHYVSAGQDPSARRCAYLDRPAATSGESRAHCVPRQAHGGTHEHYRTTHPTATPAQALREAITPYTALPRLRRLVAEHGDLAQALRCPTPPQDVLALLDLLRAMLQPNPRDQIKSPTDAAESIL